MRPSAAMTSMIAALTFSVGSSYEAEKVMSTRRMGSAL